jgi:TadE-like protein
MRWRSARGSVLVEFALVSLLLYLLLAATIEFGRLMFSAQGTQDVARLAARELALAPLPADITFEEALVYVDPGSGASPVHDRIFNPACLVVDLGGFGGDDADAQIDAFFAAMPLVNRALRPFMFIDRGTDSTLLRYPGALLNSGDPTATCAGRAAPFTVGIPRVTARGAEGEETIEWVKVLEEIRSDPADPTTGPFALGPEPTHEGIVAVRINYPYQAAMISAFKPSTVGPFESDLSTPIVANDGFSSTPPSGTLRNELDPTDDAYYGPYAGRYGLGRLATPLGKGAGVRPFRKLLAAQAIYRREVFQ